MDKNEKVVTTRYRLANGRYVQVKVTIGVKKTLDASDRQVKNQKRRDRWNKRVLLSTDYMDATIAASQRNIEDMIVEMDEAIRLKAAIATLPVGQRRRLLLHAVKGLTHQQIADMENVRRSSITKSIKKAIWHLQREFEK